MTAQIRILSLHSEETTVGTASEQESEERSSYVTA